jgi:hypothetical protein
MYAVVDPKRLLEADKEAGFFKGAGAVKGNGA